MRKLRKDDHGLRGGLPAAVLALLLLPTLAGAQDGAERYQPARTRADYDTPAVSEDDYDYAAQTLRVSVWLDRDQDEIYNRGDEQRVTFQTNEDAYAVVYRIDTDGLVNVLWPRDRLDDGFVFGGHEYRLPGREAPALRIREEEGEGYVQAVVSRYPFDLRALEIDFLGEGGDDYAFRVAGDPFLAMNEVNFAITGLEDSRDAVITNHARYYVHRVVDHPRYLCSQCHTDDTTRYDPYAGRCTLEIDYDYGWSNRWYATYGYYPVYWNPVYVYVDPWTWRPWVNFWYDPWYVCAPWQGWRGSYWGCYTWYDSPYYHGNCWSRWEGGDRRHRPLNRHGDSVAVRKVREFDKVSRQVTRSRLDDSERSAMVARRPLARRDDGKGVSRGDAKRPSTVAVARGEKPMVRDIDRFTSSGGSQRGGGLRIRPEAGGSGSTAVVGERPVRRHTAGGGERAPSLQPVRPVRRSAGEPVRGGAEGVRGAPSTREQDRDGVRALNPRQSGTRTWNSGGSRGGQGIERPTRVRPSDGERGRDEAPAERPTRVRPNDGARGRDEAPTERPTRVRPNDGARDRDEAPAERPTRSPRRDDGPSRRDEAPRAVRETPAPARETQPAAREAQPAPQRQEAPRRSVPARGRDTGDGAGRSGDNGDSRSGDAPARRAPAPTRR